MPKEIVFGSGQTYPELEAIEREAWLIATGIAQGAKWDWSSWCWKKEG